MHELNKMRLLSGIRMDPSLERLAVTEARKTPLRRSDLTAKDQKSLTGKVAGLKSAIKHLQNAIKALDKIPATDFGGDIPHMIAELEDVLEGDNGSTGLIHLLDAFDKDQQTHLKAEKQAAKAKAEEEESSAFHSEMSLDENEQLSESRWTVKVKHRDTDGFDIIADTRQEAEDKAKARLAQMKGGKGLIISIKSNSEATTSNDSRMAKKLDAMEQKEKDALLKKADQKARAGGSLSPIEDYVLTSSNYKNSKAQSTSSTDTPKKENKEEAVTEGASNGKYEVGDRVRTSMGNGTIKSEAKPNGSFFKDQPSRHASDDFYDVELDKDDELAKKLRVAGQTHKFGSFDFKGHVKESMHYYVDNKYTNYEEDKDKPVNVTDGSANDEQVWDKRGTNNDESPSQLDTKQDDQSNKMKIPAEITSQLKTEIDQARKEAKRLDSSNRDAANFYNDLANAFEDLHDKLKAGTIHDFKEAQIFAQTLMGPMLHKIPNDVWKFLTNGGTTRSLKSYMQEVK